MIEQEVIDNLLKSTDIVSVISSYIPVVKKGRSYLALCPFHDDKHPSMNISKEKQIYKCFSCGEGGNAITFIQHYEKINFEEAARKLAELVGFHDPRLYKANSVKKVDPSLEALYKCINDLQDYYVYSLSTSEASKAREYLSNRGISQVEIETYGIGYSPMDGKKTIQFLQAKGHSLKSIEDIGITLAKASGSSDNNAGRIIFPLHNPNGQVVGFSARRIQNDDSSKYINSPETKIFHKGQILYNYHNAKKYASHDGYVYVLEGFMDTISLGRAGIKSAIALMGTALTKDQIGLLRRLRAEVRLCLDGDDPGQIGMMKAIKPLQTASIPFRLVLNEADKRDPDDIYQENGKDALIKAMNSLVDPFDFQLSYYLNVKSLSTSEDKKKALLYFLPYLKEVKSSLERDDYINKLSKVTGFLPETIRNELRKISNINETIEEDIAYSLGEKHSSLNEKEKATSRLYKAEFEFLYYMFNYSEAVKSFEISLDSFYDKNLDTAANILVELAPNQGNISSLLAYIDNRIEGFENPNKIKDIFIDISKKHDYPPLTKDVLETLIKTILAERKKQKENRILVEEYTNASSEEEKLRSIEKLLEEKRKQSKND